MNMVDRKKGKFMFNRESHTEKLAQHFCMMLEEQHLVDVIVHCGNCSLHVHKNVLSLNSEYFKEHFDNRNVKEVIINGLNIAVTKALIEFMYCGELALKEEELKYFISAVKLFKLTALEKLFTESDLKIYAVDEISILPPQFICQSPQYSTVLNPYTNMPAVPKINYPLCNDYDLPPKYLVLDADKACAKEAQASRIALANLRKTMSSNPSLFIVEEPYCETTIENFIPNADYVESENVPAVENFENTINPIITSVDTPDSLLDKDQELAANQIQDILDNNEVEIMFTTNDGNLMKYSDNVYLSKDGLQYQVLGEYNETQEMKGVASSEHLANNAENVKVIRRHDDFVLDLSMDIREENDHNLNSNLENDNQNTSKLQTDLYGSMQNFMTSSMKPDSTENLQSQNVPSAEKDKHTTYTNLSEILTESSNPVEIGTETNKRGDFNNTDASLETEDLFKPTGLKFTPDMFFNDLPPSAFR